MSTSELLAYVILFVILMGFIWFMVDTYLLTHHGGKLKRGIKVWSRPLTDEEQKFLSSLDHDIVKTEEHGKWVKRKSVSFIAISNGEALIRYTHPKQSTSWPMVSYVDLTYPAPELEYRMSLPGLLLWLAFASIPVKNIFTTGYFEGNLFILAVFIIMLGVSIFMEVRENERFLACQIGTDSQPAQPVISR